MTQRRWVCAIALLVAGVVALPACGKHGDSKADESTSAPENARTSPAVVATGLHQIDAITKQMAAQTGTDNKTAVALGEQIEPIWRRIEGTVKANDQTAYLIFEDNFALLKKAAKDGNHTNAQHGADAVSKAVADYVGRFPG